jgi:hypothetical protein
MQDKRIQAPQYQISTKGCKTTGMSQNENKAERVLIQLTRTGRDVGVDVGAIKVMQQ